MNRDLRPLLVGLTELLVEWPLADIARFFDDAGIVVGSLPYRVGARRFLVKRCLEALDLNDERNSQVILALVGRVLIDTERRASSAGTPGARARLRLKAKSLRIAWNGCPSSNEPP